MYLILPQEHSKPVVAPRIDSKAKLEGILGKPV